LEKIKAKLLAQKPLTENIYQLRWQATQGKLDFIPGQYVIIQIESGGRTVKRAYSISSDPDELPEFEMTVRRFPDGLVSSWLTDLPIGSELELTGPLGIFTAKLGENDDKVLVAIGCGIAPLKSVLSYWLKNTGNNVYLFYGNRYLSGVPYHDYFKDQAAKNNNFKYFPCISRLEEGQSGVYAGRVYDVMSDELSDFMQKDFYLCGSKEMIAEVREFLLGYGVDKKNIFFEQIFI